jgi:putative flippase GtrA
MTSVAVLPASFRRQRFTRFAGVGLAGFVVQLAALWGLSRLGLGPLMATTLAVEAAVLHNFAWHQRWTWADRTGGSLGRRLLRFHAATGLTSIAGNVVFTAIYTTVGHMPLLAANVLAVATMSVLTFAIADRWVFGGVSNTMRSDRVRLVAAAIVVLAGANAPAVRAAELKPVTLQAWDRYVTSTESRIDRELADGDRFLAVDFVPGSRSQEVRGQIIAGAVVVEPVESVDRSGAEIDVPSGSIHHWRGYVYIPNASVDDLVDAVRDPEGRRAHHQQDVLVARVLSRDTGGLRLYLKLQRSSIVTVAYNTEHLVRYSRYTADRASSRSVATRIAEIEDLGKPTEHELPIGHDRGFMWRLNSYWRYQAAPGGVVVELESVTLSRELPWGLRTLVRPIVNLIARESMERTLTAMRARFAPLSTSAAVAERTTH